MSADTAKPVLFLAFASEVAGSYLPRLPEEAETLRSVLRKAEDAGWCDVEIRQDVTLKTILDFFQDPRYHARIALFHYAGHADAYDLLLTDAQGNAKTANAKGFAAFLAEQPGLAVVFLNACSTQPQVDDLLTAGVKAVIATGADIPDAWALPFAERVYAGLAGGSGLASAFRAAEAALRAEVGEQAWPWKLFPAPEGGTLAGWRLKTVQVAPSTYLWVNVPAKPTDPLLGRDALLDDLVARLLAGHSPALSTDGLPGVGKTALAVALAHDERIRSHFTDGVLWGGLGVNPDVVTIQNQWATAVGADLTDEPDVHRRLQRLSNAVGERRVLVVIDDAWDGAAAQALRLSSPNVVHLLTSRDRKIARDFAGAGQQVHVLELAEAPAWALLERLAPEACAADAAAAQALVKTVGELPLAIEVLGGYLAGHDLTVFPDLAEEAFASMGDAKQRLALAAERLGGQPGKRETLDAAIRLSVAALPEDAATVFWSLGAFAPKPATFDRAAAQAVIYRPKKKVSLLQRLFGSKRSPSEVTFLDQTLAVLVQRNLVEAADGELSVHQVVHDVMAGAMPREAVKRHTGYYLDLVNADRGDWRRIETVYEQVRFAWQSLASGAASAQLFQFVWRLRVYQERRGIWRDKLAWCERALTYAQAEDMTSEQASMLFNLGGVYSALGEKGKALEYYAQALPLDRQVGDKGGEAATLTNLGGVYSDLGEKAKALEYYEQALPLFRQVGDKGGEAAAFNNLGSVYADLGEKAKALEYYEQALPLYRQVRDKDGEATTLNNLGYVYSDLGEKAKALEYYEQALPLRRQVGDKGGEATTLTNLGSVYADLGEQAKALEYYEQALPLYRQVRDKDGEATTLNNLGYVYSDLGEKAKALEYYEQALPLRRQVGDRWGEKVTRFNMAMVAEALGDLAKAEAELQIVVGIDEAVGHPDLASDRRALECIRQMRSDA